MKTYVIILGFIVSLSCSSQNQKKSYKQETDTNFSLFISKFNTLQLPLDISRLNDFDKYADNDWKEIKGKTVLIPNKVFLPIETDEYKFIREKYPTNKNFKYRRIYKKVLKDYILLVIKQTNHLTDDYFLKLNIHSLSGNLIDTLTIAGQKIDDYNRFCRIDSNLRIKIRTLNFFPDTQNGALNGLETIEEYNITEDGHFKRIYANQEKGYFRIEDDGLIRFDQK